MYVRNKTQQGVLLLENNQGKGAVTWPEAQHILMCFIPLIPSFLSTL